MGRWVGNRWVTAKQAILEALERKHDWMSITDLTESTGANYNTVRGAIGLFVKDGTLESRSEWAVTKGIKHRITIVKLRH